MTDEINIIKQAIINEIEGFEFYRMAAKQEVSEETRNAFMQLSQEELIHVEWLQKFYDLLVKSKSDAFEIAFSDNPPSMGIFPKAPLMRNPSLAMTVFSIGIQMEKASIEFYKNAEQNTSLPSAKQLFNLLANWEENHLRQFTEHYEDLKGEWWDRQNFHPF